MNPTPSSTAVYCSIWDWSGAQVLEADCTVDLDYDPPRVLSVELIDLEEHGLQDAVLLEEYLLLESGQKIESFDVYDGADRAIMKIRCGEPQD